MPRSTSVAQARKWAFANSKPPAYYNHSNQDARPGAARTIMALKRRDVILAAVAVFIAWGYLTHWQPKLHYLPHAFLRWSFCNPRPAGMAYPHDCVEQGATEWQRDKLWPAPCRVPGAGKVEG